MSKSLSTISTLAAAGLLIGAVQATTAAAAEEHSWKLASAWGGGPLHELGAKGFAKNVEMLTDGRIKIQVFAAGSLGK